MKISLHHKVLKWFLIFCLSSFLAGCSQLNCTQFGDILGKETNLIDFSYHIADSLLDTSHPPLIPGHPEMPILVTTFVDNNDLQRTSSLGRSLQEHISSRLVQRGYAVKEVKLAKQLLIAEKSGESILSRDITRLSTSQNVQAFVVGTISSTQETMYISTRFINPINKTIISAADYRLCIDDTIRAMFFPQTKKQAYGEEAIPEPSRPWLNRILY